MTMCSLSVRAGGEHIQCQCLHVIQDMKKACTGAECISSIIIRFDSNGKDHLETPIHEINEWIRTVKTKIEF